MLKCGLKVAGGGDLSPLYYPDTSVFVIFQIDSMATDRSETSSSGEKQALFQILIEMNNLKNPAFANVSIICATNDPEECYHISYSFFVHALNLYIPYRFIE